MAIIFGNNNNNILPGTAVAGSIFGRGGSDQLFGQDGDDRLNGGTGNDLLNGSFGKDTADYSSGILNGQAFVGATAGVTVNLNLVGAQNTVGAGFDQLVNIEHRIGTNFNDTLTGNAAINLLSGEGGNDQLNGGDGGDQLNGGNGYDLLNGGTGADTMIGGGNGNDTYIVDNVFDVTTEFSNDVFVSGVDTVQSSVTRTLGFGLEHLTLTGGAPINGTGNGNNNNLTGNGANNVLSGLAGNDMLFGLSGNDQLNSGDGNDTLTGGSGIDLLNGGTGADTFDYNAVSESPAGGGDTITGFAGGGAGLGDRIDLSTIDANGLLADGNQSFSYIGGAAFTAAGQLRYSGGVLSASTDADATAEFQLTLLGAPMLVVGGTGSDILL